LQDIASVLGNKQKYDQNISVFYHFLPKMFPKLATSRAVNMILR